MARYLLGAISALFLLLASSALAQSIGEKTGVNAAVGITPSTADFVKLVAISDMFEIESSKSATQKGDAAIKAFANQMITDHTKTSADLKTLVSSGKVQAELPMQPDQAHQAKLEKLRSLTGADFNNQYRSDQIEAHKEAVSLFERYSKGGDNSDLKAWAAATLPTLQGHLKMAEALKS